MNDSFLTKYTKEILVGLFIVVVAVSRILMNVNGGVPILSNFTPIGAMALFGGAYFSKRTAFIFPLLTLWISDIIISSFYYGKLTFFYEGAGWVYGTFFLIVIVGMYVLRTKKWTNMILASFVAVLVHWIVTDFGVWISGTMYPKTASGFWACLVAAIPFERNFLLGTIMYSSFMIGAYEWMKSKYPSFSFS